MEKAYWVWLSLAFGAGNSRANEILQYYANPRDFYEKLLLATARFEPLKTNEFLRLKELRLDQAVEIVEHCARIGVQILTQADRAYPQRLKNIAVPPIVLYTIGDVSVLNSHPSVTIIGSREVTVQGERVSEQMGYELSRNGVVIVSGMAVGGDIAAIRGALRGGTPMIGVIGCGCDIDYPRENRPIRELVDRFGGIISEYPPGTRPEGRNFPVRNRILSGVSLATVVTECREKSGALVTAGLALEQGREVLAVPTSALDNEHTGTFQLLRDGAAPVRNGYDVMEELGIEPRLSCDTLRAQPIPPLPSLKPSSRPVVAPAVPVPAAPNVSIPASQPAKPEPKPEKPVKKSVEKPAKKSADRPVKEEKTVPMPTKEPASTAFPDDLSEDARRVLGLLTDEPISILTLSAEFGLGIPALLGVITELEMEQLIQTLPGRRYKRA